MKALQPMQPRRFLHIYCDESHQTADRYMVIGGVILTSEMETQFAQAMAMYRADNKMNAEIKWTKVSNQKQREYQALVDLFFSLNRSIHFKAIVIDTREIDHKRFNKNDAELGFYKLMYQFLLNSFGRYLQTNDQCIITLDERTTSYYKLSTLCAVLNNGLHKKYPNLNQPIRNIQATDSKKSDLIQVADVLMGAIGYQMNDAHICTNAKKSKVVLAEYVAHKAGLINLKRETPFASKNFSIWHFHFYSVLKAKMP
jgi:hypothetical protein